MAMELEKSGLLLVVRLDALATLATEAVPCDRKDADAVVLCTRSSASLLCWAAAAAGGGAAWKGGGILRC